MGGRKSIMYEFTIVGLTESKLTETKEIPTEITLYADSYTNACGKAEAIMPGCDKYIVVKVVEIA